MYVFKPWVWYTFLSFPFIALSPALIFEESGYFKSICRRQSYWIWFMIPAFKLMLSLPFAPRPPPKDCGSSRPHFLILLQCLLWWWTWKLSKSFVKYCLSTKSVKCQYPASSPCLHCSLFESTCLIVKSWCKRVTRPVMVERTPPSAPSPPPLRVQGKNSDRNDLQNQTLYFWCVLQA